MISLQCLGFRCALPVNLWLDDVCRVLAIQVLPANRRNILADLLTVYANAGKTIVFTQTKREADEVAAGIAGVIPSEVLFLLYSLQQSMRCLSTTTVPDQGVALCMLCEFCTFTP